MGDILPFPPRIVDNVEIHYKAQSSLGVRPRSGLNLGSPKSKVETHLDMRCYYRRTLKHRPNGLKVVRVYLTNGRIKQRIDVDAVTASWIEPGKFYTLEQIADAPRRKRRGR